MFKKVLIGFSVFSILALLLLQIDDDLHPEIPAFLEQAQPAEYSEAYLYLLGFEAAEGEDPLTAGKQFLGNESLKFKLFAGEGEKLALPQGELFCNPSDEACWQTIFVNRHHIEQRLKTHSVLLERYQAFIELDDYRQMRTSTGLSMALSFVHEYLENANRLVILKAVHTARTGKGELAIKNLTENILLLRQKLKSADDFFGKVIYVGMISEAIDALSLLIYQEQFIIEESLPPISLAERDLSTVVANEFKPLYKAFYQPLIPTNIDQRSFSSWKKVLFKLNMTINDGFLVYKELGRRSKLDPIEFANVNFKKLGVPYYKLPLIRNYMGNRLNSIMIPFFFEDYIPPLFDLNAKIAIFNQTANKAELPIDLDTIQNPYYETGNTAYYSENGKSICLTGPFEDDDNLRCLRVKL